MRLNHGMIALALSATMLVSASAMTGCATGGVVYDPYRREYYRWNRSEDRLYREWEVEGHRTHLAFQRRSPGDLNGYWGWRHRQPARIAR
jgi:hypothetical protein